ncbi:ABC transporter [Pirellula staleyi DSM 6068]|uniref:ABC transporter n=1 Tax=Pirellula staleyi (strain ATCC 27377 / DSM 6068 / ICPB 4128) TaxID=530564 RepID=D2R600_PIRSD|nr:restriction system-associated AAA family ATPase [Pirellula staleyi]ADB19085.1 ABC transporter [Pirellula staleyi DSM 6068]
MKLIRLKLDVPFRSLPAGFEIDFLRDWDFDRCFEFHPYCFAGRNGSGKSNVLEALVAIFYHIECIHLEYRPEGFEYDKETNPDAFRAESCTPDAFELEYFIPISFLSQIAPNSQGNERPCRIRIVKKANTKPEVLWLNEKEFKNDDYKSLVRNEVKSVLPRFILGYSSGRNEILSLPFFKMRFIHFDEYRAKVVMDDHYSRPEGRMVYLDEQFSQAILICHFLFPSAPVIRVFEEKVGLRGIQRFRIIIRRHHRYPLIEEYLKTHSETQEEPSAGQSVELTSKLSALIDKLTQCSTAYFEDYSSYEDGEGYDLYLDYWVNDATKRAFQVHFGEASGESPEVDKAKSALNLFQSFQILLTLNNYLVAEETKDELYQSSSLYVNETISTPASHERITRFKEGELIKDGVTGPLYIKSLSDGEHQFLHTIGLCLLYRHESALFLLDEPETHLNPDWRASYISTLRAALEADAATKNVMREVLLTSHSPFIISDCRKENVLVFATNPETQAVTWQRPDFETFGASANAITMKVFGQIETIGDYAMSTLNALRKRLEEGEDPDVLIKEAGKELGDSVEKVLFVNQAIKKKEGK